MARRWHEEADGAQVQGQGPDRLKGILEGTFV